jgi:carbonic anhydrase
MMIRSTTRVRFFVSAGVLSVLALTACRSMPPSSEDWSYHGTTGPRYWASLREAWRICGAGDRQSPANLQGATVQPPAFTVEYDVAPALEVSNSGHDIRADPRGLGSLSLDGTQYPIQEFHFHTRSEHRFETPLGITDFPIEMHIVHQNGNRRVVLGVFIVPVVPGEQPNPELSKIWENLPAEPGQTTTVTDFDLEELVPADRSAYRYAGSLTTPACDQNVSWFVLRSPIYLTTEQILKMERAFSGDRFPEGNRRPVQRPWPGVLTDGQKP